MPYSVSKSSSSSSDDDVSIIRRGPWTVEEDTLLVNFISRHGEGRWNMLAKCAGLKRTGKSCRLRWLNYLKPDVKRGNLTPQEQLMILELHSKLGNRWSKIAEYLPGRTDNEIKNYWRTRVQKQARHLKIDCNSVAFQQVIQNLWVPRLLQKIQCTSASQSDRVIINETRAQQGLSFEQNSSSSSSPSSESLNVSKIPEYPTIPPREIGDSDLNSFVKAHFPFGNKDTFDMDNFSSVNDNFNDMIDYDQMDAGENYLAGDVLGDNFWSMDEF